MQIDGHEPLDISQDEAEASPPSEDLQRGSPTWVVNNLETCHISTLDLQSSRCIDFQLVDHLSKWILPFPCSTRIAIAVQRGVRHGWGNLGPKE